MRNSKLAWGGILLLGTMAAWALPRIAGKTPHALRRAAGVTHRSGVSNPGVRTTADPSRGFPA